MGSELVEELVEGGLSGEDRGSCVMGGAVGQLWGMGECGIGQVTGIGWVEFDSS